LNLTNKHILRRVIKKNRGNQKLLDSIKRLIEDIENGEWNNPNELLKNRPDADSVYGGKFFFFNINIHRTLILIEFEENGEATIVWAGNHDDYELTFQNNRTVIKKWLKNKYWI
jgi:mRNA-degrading endonuclease HigB of HigAB toxin-antitoxin module